MAGRRRPAPAVRPGVARLSRRARRPGRGGATAPRRAPAPRARHRPGPPGRQRRTSRTTSGDAGEPAVVAGTKGRWRVDPALLGRPFAGSRGPALAARPAGVRPEADRRPVRVRLPARDVQAGREAPVGLLRAADPVGRPARREARRHDGPRRSACCASTPCTRTSRSRPRWPPRSTPRSRTSPRGCRWISTAPTDPSPGTALGSAQNRPPTGTPEADHVRHHRSRPDAGHLAGARPGDLAQRAGVVRPARPRPGREAARRGVGAVRGARRRAPPRTTRARSARCRSGCRRRSSTGTPTPSRSPRRKGAWLTDVDGRKVLDLSMGFGAMLAGHLNPRSSRPSRARSRPARSS